MESLKSNINRIDEVISSRINFLEFFDGCVGDNLKRELHLLNYVSKLHRLINKVILESENEENLQIWFEEIFDEKKLNIPEVEKET